jgi:hypothetical protein
MPGLVQHASAKSASNVSSLAATFGAGTTSGNTIVDCASEAFNQSSVGDISSVALTGASDTFAQAVVEQNTTLQFDTEIWYDSNCSGGHTVVTNTFSKSLGTSGGSAFIDLYEYSGVTTSSPVDKTNGGNSNSSSTYSSGSSGTLSQASEVAFGCALALTSGSMSAPASPWINETQQTESSNDTIQQSGYQQVSATTALTYNGTLSLAGGYSAVIATFKLSGAITVNLPLLQISTQLFPVTLPPVTVNLPLLQISTQLFPVAPEIEPQTPVLIIAIVPQETADPVNGQTCPQGVTNWQPVLNSFVYANLGNAFLEFNYQEGQYEPAAIGVAGRVGTLQITTGTITIEDNPANITMVSEQANSGSSNIDIAADEWQHP